MASDTENAFGMLPFCMLSIWFVLVYVRRMQYIRMWILVFFELLIIWVRTKWRAEELLPFSERSWLLFTFLLNGWKCNAVGTLFEVLILIFWEVWPKFWRKATMVLYIWWIVRQCYNKRIVRQCYNKRRLSWCNSALIY